nr:MAG TPA: hypothetical protein [Bacteriophage sp.]
MFSFKFKRLYIEHFKDRFFLNLHIKMFIIGFL